MSLGQLKEKVDGWLFVVEEKEEKEERQVVGKSKAQRKYDKREHLKETKL